MVDKISVITALICLASITTAQTVTLGTFGYSSQDIGAGGLQILANQFVVGDEFSVTIGEAFGDSLSEGSELYIWDGSSYLIYSYVAGTWFDINWGDASNVAIDRGDALWAKNAAAIVAAVVFSGDVPESVSTTNALVSGYNMLANPYPTSITLGELDISPSDGEELFLWDGSGYLIYSYVAGAWYDIGWGDASGVEIPVGCGFWYNALTARFWIFAKPY